MVLDRYRHHAPRYFRPFAVAMGQAGVTPNVVSILSLGFAFAAAGFFIVASPWFPAALLAAAALTGLNAFFDGLDGVLARYQGTASRRGDYLDHVIDRYADLAILIGISLSPLADVRLGLLAIAGTFMTSYMGTQAQALGLGRNYGGMLGRADRLVLLMGAPLLEYVLLWQGVPLPVVGGVTVGVLNVVLAYIALAGNLTAIQRFRRGWQELDEEIDAPRKP